MTADELRAMLAEDHREWQTLCAALDAHPDGPLHDPESPEWTARDVYTHLARMMESTTALLEAKLGHPHPGREAFPEFQRDGEDAVNARIQEKYQRLTLDEARAWAQRAFDQRVLAIEAVPISDWSPMLEEIARGDGAQHYRGHRSYIHA